MTDVDCARCWSPAGSRLEDWLLGAEPRAIVPPLYLRMRAFVPHVLYVNYLADIDFACRLAPRWFVPNPWPEDPRKTLFTILVFEMERGRPVWAPAALEALSPRLMQSNWRFYGSLREDGRPSVLFWRTVTDSLPLAFFGRRIARCFPLHRARRMTMRMAAVGAGAEVRVDIDAGRGSAPALSFRGVEAARSVTPAALRSRFPNFDDYARAIADQHLSLTVWRAGGPREEGVVQDMHLTLDAASFREVEATDVRVPSLGTFVDDPARPLSCFVARDLGVWLDSIRSGVSRRG